MIPEFSSATFSARLPECHTKNIRSNVPYSSNFSRYAARLWLSADDLIWTKARSFVVGNISSMSTVFVFFSRVGQPDASRYSKTRDQPGARNPAGVKGHQRNDLVDHFVFRIQCRLDLRQQLAVDFAFQIVEGDHVTNCSAKRLYFQKSARQPLLGQFSALDVMAMPAVDGGSIGAVTVRVLPSPRVSGTGPHPDLRKTSSTGHHLPLQSNSGSERHPGSRRRNRSAVLARDFTHDIPLPGYWQPRMASRCLKRRIPSMLSFPSCRRIPA